MGLVRGYLGPVPEDKEYRAFFPAGPVGGCLRPAPEDRGNRAFFPLFISLFGECFLEALKGQGPWC